MPELDTIATLINTGIGALGLYLYFTERTQHGITRSEYIQEIKTLNEQRIMDYKVWLDMLGDMIIAGKSNTVFPLPDKLTPVKSVQPPKS